jgi:hypothetical protein
VDALYETCDASKANEFHSPRGYWEPKRKPAWPTATGLDKQVPDELFPGGARQLPSAGESADTRLELGSMEVLEPVLYKLIRYVKLALLDFGHSRTTSP